MDPDMDWLHLVQFKQPEYMWIFQLEQDTDVIAQYEAIVGLRGFVYSFKALDALKKVTRIASIYFFSSFFNTIFIKYPHCFYHIGLNK